MIGSKRLQKGQLYKQKAATWYHNISFVAREFVQGDASVGVAGTHAHERAWKERHTDPSVTRARRHTITYRTSHVNSQNSDAPSLVEINKCVLWYASHKVVTDFVRRQSLQQYPDKM